MKECETKACTALSPSVMVLVGVVPFSFCFLSLLLVRASSEHGSQCFRNEGHVIPTGRAAGFISRACATPNGGLLIRAPPGA